MPPITDHTTASQSNVALAVLELFQYADIYYRANLPDEIKVYWTHPTRRTQHGYGQIPLESLRKLVRFGYITSCDLAETPTVEQLCLTMKGHKVLAAYHARRTTANWQLVDNN